MAGFGLYPVAHATFAAGGPGGRKVR